jgi:phasin
MRLQLNRHHRASISAHDGAKSNQSKIVAKHRRQTAQHHTVDDLATAAVPPSALMPRSKRPRNPPASSPFELSLCTLAGAGDGRSAKCSPGIPFRRLRLQRRGAADVITHITLPEVAAMIEPKLEVPVELRDLAEKTIEQAERAFRMFFDAASKSMASVPGGGTEISKQALSFTEQNMKAAFEHARKLVHATDLQQAMHIQSEFLRSQFTYAGEHMRHITGEVMSATKDAMKGKS